STTARRVTSQIKRLALSGTRPRPWRLGPTHAGIAISEVLQGARKLSGGPVGGVPRLVRLAIPGQGLGGVALLLQRLSVVKGNPADIERTIQRRSDFEGPLEMRAGLFGLARGGGDPAGRPLGRQLRRRVGGDLGRSQGDRHPRSRQRAVPAVKRGLRRPRQQMWQEVLVADMLEL